MSDKTALMMTLDEHIKHQGWIQAEATRQQGVTQPRVSDLIRSKTNLFSLPRYTGHLGING